MTAVLARATLALAALATLAGAFIDHEAAGFAAALAAALFPAGLFLLPEGDRRPPAWIAALAVSLVSGMTLLAVWHDSPLRLGLPLATWAVWVALGLLPFVLTVYGVLRSPAGDDPS